MTDKELKNKAIDIKGKNYVMVKDRILYFNEKYEAGCIKTKLLSDPTDKEVVIKAYVYPVKDQPDYFFTGHASETVGGQGVNRTAAMENAETSAVGRALAMMGIGVLDSVASVDEMAKAGVRITKKVEGGTVSNIEDPATPKQVALLKKNGIDGTKMSKMEASKKIGDILNASQVGPGNEPEEESVNPDDIPF